MLRLGLSRAGARDLVIAIGVFVVSLVILLPYVEVGMSALRGDHQMGADELTYLSNAVRVVRGEVLYRDVFEFKGPFGLVPALLAFWLFRPGVATGRIATVVVVALWAVVMYGAGRHLTRSRVLGALIALAVPLYIWPTWPYAFYEFVGQVFLAGAAVFACTARVERPWAWRAAGACLAGTVWTNMGHGLPALVAFTSAAALTTLAFGRTRDAVNVLGNVLLGLTAVSGAVLLVLVVSGTVGPALHTMFVFPFQDYRRSPYNITGYGNDGDSFISRWRTAGWVPSHAVKLIVGATLLLPRLSVAVGGVAAIYLGVLLVQRLRHRAGAPGGPDPSYAVQAQKAILSASLAAAAVPVALAYTRADLCHLGFVEGSSLLAVLGFAFNVRVPLPRRFAGRGLMAIRRWFRRVVVAAAVVAVAAGASFHIYCLRQPHNPETTDAYARRRYDTDQVIARTSAGDEIFVAPFGGWHYLLTARRPAVPYSAIFDDVYSVDQWPVAAHAVAGRRPRLLILNDKLFGRLTKIEPRIASLYFGVSGNYILDDRRPGPPLAFDRPWQLSQGSHGKPASLVIRGGAAHSARLTATLVAPGAPSHEILGSVDQDIVCFFDGPETYVGQLSQSGDAIRGSVFKGGRGVSSFTATRANPPTPAPSR